MGTIKTKKRMSGDSEVIAILRSVIILCHILAYSGTSLSVFKYKNAVFNGEQENIHYLCEDGIDKTHTVRSPFVITW